MLRAIMVCSAIALSYWNLPLLAATRAMTACAVCSAQDAITLVGSPLGTVFKNEAKPRPENGYDHDTVCGYFPKGYDIQKADGPPERGVQVQLHTMRTNADAKTFYARFEDMSMTSGGPFPDSKLTPLPGMAEAAFMRETTLEPTPGAVYHVASVTFLKGKAMGQVTVWKKAAAVDKLATRALQQVLAKLP